MGVSDLCRVTGGAGFIGTHPAEALTAAVRPVRVPDDFSTDLRENLDGPQPKTSSCERSPGRAATRIEAGASTSWRGG